jgi:hypothetical protein
MGERVGDLAASVIAVAKPAPTVVYPGKAAARPSTTNLASGSNSNSGENFNNSSNSGERSGDTKYTLTVKKIGGGVVGEITGGTVTGAGINCGKTCSGKYKKYSFVTLTASTNSTSRFVGWNVVGGSNICPDRTRPCSVDMESNVTVIATYAKLACSMMTAADKTLLDKLGTVLSRKLTGSETQVSIIEQVVRNPDVSAEEKDDYIKQIRLSACLFLRL